MITEESCININDEKVYRCAKCGNELFHKEKQFRQGPGFPGFTAAIFPNVKEKHLTTYGRERIQIVCSNCGTHLGHLFMNGPPPSYKRYCIVPSSIV